MAKKIMIDGDIGVTGIAINANMLQKFVSMSMIITDPSGDGIGQMEISAGPTETAETDKNELIPSFDDLLATPEGAALYEASQAFMTVLAGYSKKLKLVDVVEEPEA